MQIRNVFQSNDWEIKRFLGLVLASQLAMLGLIGLDAIGLGIPFVRAAFSLLNFTFIPGLIILRILKLHRLNTTTSFLFSVGLSIAFLTAVGLLVNLLYPVIGISRPISPLPLIITLEGFLFLLCIVSYRRDKDFAEPTYIDTRELISSPNLFLVLLPLLSVLGTSVMNLEQDNRILLLLLALIAIVPAIVVFTRFIPGRSYPLAVVAIAVALLYHQSLMTSTLIGYDIQGEYWLQELVATNARWNPSTPVIGGNAMLSITILPAVYRSLLNIDGIWMLKAVYPLIFSVTVLGLYEASRKQIGEKGAFLAMFFFMSFGIFSFELIQLAKQEISEVFYALSILLLLDKDIEPAKSKVLYLIFGIELVLAHYGAGYVYVFISLPALAIVYMLKTRTRLFTFGSVALFFVIALSWYMYVTGSAIFSSGVFVGRSIYDGVITEFFVPGTRQALVIATAATPSLLHEAARYLQYLAILLIIAGTIRLVSDVIRSRERMQFHQDFVAYSLVSFIVGMLMIVLPYFSGALTAGRTFHIALFFLAPVSIIGVATVFSLGSRVFSRPHFAPGMGFMAVFLAVFLLFNTQFIYHIAKDNSKSIALDAGIDYPAFNEREYVASKWLEKAGIDEYRGAERVWADRFARLLLMQRYIPYGIWIFWGDDDALPGYPYIFLRGLQVVDGKIPKSLDEEFEYTDLEASAFFQEVLVDRNKIYDNGGAQWYYAYKTTRKLWTR